MTRAAALQVVRAAIASGAHCDACEQPDTTLPDGRVVFCGSCGRVRMVASERVTFLRELTDEERERMSAILTAYAAEPERCAARLNDVTQCDLHTGHASKHMVWSSGRQWP